MLPGADWDLPKGSYSLDLGARLGALFVLTQKRNALIISVLGRTVPGRTQVLVFRLLRWGVGVFEVRGKV